MALGQIKAECLGFYGGVETIAQAAYVSTGASEGKTYEDKLKLIDYLVKHRHASPFRFAGCTIRLRIPIFCDREIVTHTVAIQGSVGESARYRNTFSEFYTPDDLTDTTNYKGACAIAMLSYHRMIKDTPANATKEQRARIRELARGVLPVATMVERIIQVNINGLCSIMRQRLAIQAQLEIRDTAQKILKCLPSEWEFILNKLEEYGWNL